MRSPETVRRLPPPGASAPFGAGVWTSREYPGTSVGGGLVSFSTSELRHPAGCVRVQVDLSNSSGGNRVFCSDLGIWSLNISNRRHNNHSQNHKYDSELEQHRQQREKHPTNLATNCLAARPHHRLANKQSNCRDEKEQRPDKLRGQAWDLELVGKKHQQKISSRAEEC